MADIDSPEEGSPHPTGSSAESRGRSSEGSSGASAAGERPGRRSWLLPVLALVLGLALGAGLMALVNGGDTTQSPIAEDGATPTTTTAPTTDATTPTVGIGDVVIPASCLQIADESQTLNRVLVDGVRAAQDLDASAMSRIVREFGRVQGQLAELSEDCRAGAGPVSPPVRTGAPSATSLSPETPPATTPAG